MRPTLPRAPGAPPGRTGGEVTRSVLLARVRRLGEQLAVVGEAVHVVLHVAARGAHSHAALEGIGLPSIHFGVGTGPFLGDMRLDGVADAVGVDWRMPLDEAISIVGPDTAVQGNIDPAMLQAPWPILEAHVRDVIARGRGAKGHILNLGHGVPPDTDPDQLTRIVEVAHGER